MYSPALSPSSFRLHIVNKNLQTHTFLDEGFHKPTCTTSVNAEKD